MPGRRSFNRSSILFSLQKKEYKSATVQLVSMQLSPEHGSQSEASDSSFSPQQSKWSRDYSIDDSYIESTSMGPIQSVLSRSKQDLLSIDSGSPNTIPRSAVVLRRQGRMANDSPSSGSEKSGPTGRPRPKSGFVTAADYEGTPLRSNLYRPRSMEMLESAKMETDSFLSKAEEGREETSRRSSGFSNSSGELSFNFYRYL